MATTSTLSACAGAIWRARPTHHRASGHGPPLGAMGVCAGARAAKKPPPPGGDAGAYQRRWIVRMTCLVLVWGGFAVGCALVGPRRIELTGFFLVQVLVCTLPLGLEILAEAIRRSLMRLESADPAARRTAWRAVAFEALAAALLTGSTIAGVLLLIERSAHVPLYPAPHFLGRDARERARHAAGTGRSRSDQRLPRFASSTSGTASICRSMRDSASDYRPNRHGARCVGQDLMRNS